MKFNNIRLLVIDNYDSFTYNLTQAFAYLGADVLIYRNDMINIAQAQQLQPTHLLISPGPGHPLQSGISIQVTTYFLGKIPILGVCLGHQLIAMLCGAQIGRAKKIMHGKADWVRHDGKGIFKNLANPFQVGRYHSLAVTHPPNDLEISARSTDNEIMAFRHRKLAAYGVQFHPESILCPQGMMLMKNFIECNQQDL